MRLLSQLHEALMSGSHAASKLDHARLGNRCVKLVTAKGLQSYREDKCVIYACIVTMPDLMKPLVTLHEAGMHQIGFTASEKVVLQHLRVKGVPSVFHGL
jgi:ligand-binding sensor protein